MGGWSKNGFEELLSTVKINYSLINLTYFAKLSYITSQKFRLLKDFYEKFMKSLQLEELLYYLLWTHLKSGITISLCGEGEKNRE